MGTVYDHTNLKFKVTIRSSSSSSVSFSSSSKSSSSESSSSSVSSSSCSWSVSSSSTSISSSSTSFSSSSTSTLPDEFRFDTTFHADGEFDYSNRDKRVSKANLAVGGNLIARTVGYKTTGKWYAEIFMESANYTSLHWPGYGIMDSAHSNTGFIGADAAAVGVGTINYFHRLYHDGGYDTYNYDWETGDVVILAWDMATGDVWFGKNGVWDTGLPGVSGSPTYTETEFIGVSAHVAIIQDASSHVMVIRSKLSEYSYTPPSGFLPLE